jgi:hypothetical protein
MVLLFTANANASEQIRREVAWAVYHGVVVLPIRIENVLPDKSLEYYIPNVQWLDAVTPPLGTHLRGLVKTIKSMATSAKAGSESGAVVPPVITQKVSPLSPSYAPALRDGTALEGTKAPTVAQRDFAKTAVESAVQSGSVRTTTADSVRSSIFISYRRRDSPHITGRIYDRLVLRFGRETVLKDVDSIPLGMDFRECLRREVGSSEVVIAVIGKNWNPLLASGQPKLSDPRDYLRIELESALERGIPVIPVLVDGMEMPVEDELPPSLVRLAYRNGMSVRPDPDFHHDVDRLVHGIEQLLK